MARPALFPEVRPPAWPADGNPAWWCLPRWPAHWAGAVLLGCAADCATAQPTEVLASTALETVVISGRAERRIGSAETASEGAVSGIDLAVRPLLRPAELLEAVPGMIAVQHSGGGKANQYFLRGFNLDHGTDFSLLLDDVPMNFRTHGHGQGYLDVNGLIPETVRRIDYRKGPYRADVGDFSLVGMASASTADSFERPFGSLQAGRYGYRRVVAGGSWSVDDTDWLLAVEGKRYDGPWQLPERLRHGSIYAKATRETELGTLRASLSIYEATWRPTEQIPERAIGTLIDSVFGSIDPDLSGRTQRSIFALRLDAEAWRLSAYVQRYDWHLSSNFTFFLDDPVSGDELEQVDQRWTYGGRAERSFKPLPGLKLVLGIEGRYDQIGKVGLYKSLGGTATAPRAVFAVDETSAAAYAEATWAATERLDLFGGLRADRYRFRSRPLEGPDAWGGTVGDRLVSPKIGAAFRISDHWALYANWGRGFHSNDSRGVTAPTDPAPGLVPGTGRELGLRFEQGKLGATLTRWWIDVGSDLIFVGDSGAVEPAGASRRHGYEVSAFWRPQKWLAVDLAWTASTARFANAPGAEHVPGALDNAGELGVAAVFDEWNAAVRLRHVGPHALTEDNSVRSDGTTLVNLRAAWTPKAFAKGRFELFAELLNLFDSRKKDVDYFYTSRLPGEPLDGVTGLHSRVVEPRSLRAGVKVSF
jgi:outer membrane receptor protein involved in Fe transport